MKQAPSPVRLWIVEGTAMARQNVLHDGQSEPRSLHLPAGADIDAIEPLRQPRDVLGGDAGSEILDANERDATPPARSSRLTSTRFPDAP